MISKEKFIKYTRALEEYNSTVKDKNKALKVLFPSSFVHIEDGNVVELILVLLSELTECFWEDNYTYYSDIDWFYYERANSTEPLKATYKDKEYWIDSWEDLYNFIVLNKK